MHSAFHRNAVLLGTLGAFGALALAFMEVPAHAAEPQHDHHHHHMNMNMKMGMDFKRSAAAYAAPDVQLVREDGTKVSLPRELDDGRPVFLTFIYTTCTTICPVISQTFSQLQQQLGDEHDKYHLVSISIDPEQDTPAKLRDYAQRFGAGPAWQHYTGSVEASLAAQRAFGVYRGDKMNHNPVVLIRSAPGQPWIKIDGFASAADLMREYHQLVHGG